MKIVIIDTYYEFFLDEFYKAHPEIKGLSYNEHWQKLMSYRFSASDAYSHAFKKLGHEAEEIVFNDNALQHKWAKENNVRVLPFPSLMAKGLNVLFGMDWRFTVLKEQIKKLKPDILYIKEQSLLTDEMVKELKGLTRLVCQQVGSRLVQRRKFTDIDLTFTSFPHFVPMFEKMGLKAHYLKICFDERVIHEIQKRPKQHEVSFVGGITLHQHKLRNELLEKTARDYPMKWFGYTTSARDQNADLKKVWQGSVWGLDMYQALADSWITINIHGEIAKQYANNVRLYEATGVGTCLLTDAKENLSEMFEVDKEIVTYSSAAEYFEKLEYLLAHKEACLNIAAAAQKRTLHDHTFHERGRELIDAFESLLE